MLPPALIGSASRMAIAALISAAFCSALAAQTRKIDSLKNVLAQTKLPDTTRVKVLNQLHKAYFSTARFNEADSVARVALTIAQRIADKLLIGQSITNIGNVLYAKGKYSEALGHYFDALKIQEEVGNKLGMGPPLNNIASIYRLQGRYKESLDYHFKSLSIKEEMKDSSAVATSLNNIGLVYAHLENFSEALTYHQKSMRIREVQNDKHGVAISLNNMSDVYISLGRYDDALKSCFVALKIHDELGEKPETFYVLLNIGAAYRGKQQFQKAIEYGIQGLKLADSLEMPENIKEAYESLSRTYQAMGNEKAAFEYFRKFVELKDSLYSKEVEKKTSELQIEYETAQKEKQIELLKRDNDITRLENEKWRDTFIGLFGVFVIIGLFVSYRYNAKRRAEKLLQEKNAALEEKTKLVEEKTAQLAKAYDELAMSKSEVELKNVALEKTLGNLSAMQQQLVQQEKLAALGELVAGVAHEIQNPLNFVNNFSEISAELCAEIADELKKPDANFANIEALLADVETNLQKVSHHGNRASTIVKSMLEHSRKSPSEKEPTDLNALLNEYLKLSYQSYRMKHHGFNAQMITKFDDAVGLVAVMPREMSQVFLNVFNNAFYAMREKAATAPNIYAPLLTIQTKRENEKIEIRIRDNGVGISDEVKRKIFQPFFTTKKSGDGTGLGLSISNDIVKAHGGSISVESIEGEFAEFVITLPTK